MFSGRLCLSKLTLRWLQMGLVGASLNLVKGLPVGVFF